MIRDLTQVSAHPAVNFLCFLGGRKQKMANVNALLETCLNLICTVQLG